MSNHDSPHYHWPGRPVFDEGEFACVKPNGRLLSVRYYPAGSTLPLTREQGARYVRVGLPRAISH